MSLEKAYDKFSAAEKDALNWLQTEMVGLRTGRIKTDIVNNIPVEYYGARTPIQGLASVAMSDARTIVITPWDRVATTAIEKALTEANVGAMPAVDGQIIRLSFPMLSEERRETTVKQLHKKAEEARVRLRLGRDEALSIIKQEKEKSALTEDDFYNGRQHLDKLIDTANNEIASRVEKKEAEIRTI